METESEKAGVHVPPPYPTSQNAMPGGTTPYPPAVSQPGYGQPVGYPGQPQNPYPPSPAQPYYPPQNPYPPSPAQPYYPPQNPYPPPGTPGPVGYYPQTTPVQAAHVGQVPYGGGQQQQQQVVVVNQGQPTVLVQSHPTESFCGHIVLSCFVFWCCGYLFGLIAFILAMVAQDRVTRDRQAARQLGHASIGVSVAGIVVGIVFIIIIGAVLGSAASRCSDYSVNGHCYSYRTYGGSCYSGYYNNGFCYY